MKEFNETNINHIKEKQNKAYETFSKSLKNMRKVCSDYFANYETNLEEVKIRQHVLENKYADWQKVLIEPATVNDARLFSVEQRVEEEEEMRIKEYEHLRDLLKKLIYSLE